MKRVVKIFLSAMLVLLMVLPLGITSKAADPFKITIEQTAANDTADHTYEAYRIFAGTLYEDAGVRKLAEITWGAGVDGAAVLADTDLPASLKGAADAYALAEKLSTADADTAAAFAKVCEKHLATKAADSTKVGDNYQISVNDPGYYLIKDKDGSLDGKMGANTRYILEIVGNVTVSTKEDVPSITKNIVEGNDRVKSNVAGIGEKVNYEITTKVPDMTGYDSYEFVFTDELSKGLTFNNDVKVTVDGADAAVVAASTTPATTGNSAYTFTVSNFIQYANKVGKDIVVTYSATVNENAILENLATGDTNTVYLEFSNDPKDTSKKGKTPEEQTITYTTEIKVVKVDGKDNTITLQNAKFKLEPKTAAETAEYLINGTTRGNEEYTDANGEILFSGLKPGNYTLTETEAPANYNKLDNPISIEIVATRQTDGSFVYTYNGDASVSVNGNVYTITIGNNKGIRLPGTGGIGTRIFYIGGGALILIAVAGLIIFKAAGKKKTEA